MELRQHLDHEIGAHVRELRAQLARSLAVDRRRHGREHRPGVEPALHLHDRDSRHPIAGEDRALDRRGAAPARQQRGMDVEAAIARRLAGSARAGSARRPRPRRRRGSRAAKPACSSSLLSDKGVRTAIPARLGAPLDGGGGERLAAPGRPRRLRIDRGHIVPRREQGVERRHGEIRGSHEGDAHGRIPYLLDYDLASRASCPYPRHHGLFRNRSADPGAGAPARPRARARRGARCCI